MNDEELIGNEIHLLIRKSHRIGSNQELEVRDED
jgi:hypothetical protein